MPIDGSIDLSTCLINQKLHLVIHYTYLIGKVKFLEDTNRFFFDDQLAICIEKKCEMNEEFLDCIGSEEDSSEASDPVEVIGQVFVYLFEFVVFCQICVLLK